MCYYDISNPTGLHILTQFSLFNSALQCSAGVPLNNQSIYLYLCSLCLVFISDLSSLTPTPPPPPPLLSSRLSETPLSAAPILSEHNPYSRLFIFAIQILHVGKNGVVDIMCVSCYAIVICVK